MNQSESSDRSQRPEPASLAGRWRHARRRDAGRRRRHRERSPSVASPARQRGLSRPRSGDLPTLSQWYHEYGEDGTQEAVQSYAAAFPDANVEVEWISGDWETAMAAALLTDEGPDVFEWVNGPNIDMIQSGQVVPLDDMLGARPSDFDQRLISRMTWDGHLWAVPQMIDMHVLLYRKSLLDEAGVEPPTTLDELIAAAAALTTGDTKGLFVGNDGGVGLLAGYPLWSAGADYLTEDNQFGFANDAVYASFAKLHELFQGDSLLLGAPTDWFDPGSFINQLTAMQLTGLWTFPQILESEVGEDFDVIAWPQLDASTGSPSLPFARVVVDRQLPHGRRRPGEGVRPVVVGRPDRQASSISPRATASTCRCAPAFSRRPITSSRARRPRRSAWSTSTAVSRSRCCGHRLHARPTTTPGHG